MGKLIHIAFPTPGFRFFPKLSSLLDKCVCRSFRLPRSETVIQREGLCWLRVSPESPTECPRRTFGGALPRFGGMAGDGALASLPVRVA